jgi:hypothetical protein
MDERRVEFGNSDHLLDEEDEHTLAAIDRGLKGCK